MAHAVRKNIALHRSSRSAKDFQIRPADAIHNYVKAPLMSASILAQCFLPVDLHSLPLRAVAVAYLYGDRIAGRGIQKE